VANKKEFREKTKQRDKQRREYLKRIKPLLFSFAGWFLVLALIQLPVIKDTVRQIMVNFTHSTVITTGKILQLPVSDGGLPVLNFSDFSMKVILECTAYNFYIFILMITLFMPWSSKNKAINFGVMAGVIFILNKMRFLIMGAIGSYSTNIFYSIHDYFWNILFALLVFIIVLWADRRSGNPLFFTNN
jgi:exosortase/archaeosortase family protein